MFRLVSLSNLDLLLKFKKKNLLAIILPLFICRYYSKNFSIQIRNYPNMFHKLAFVNNKIFRRDKVMISEINIKNESLNN